MSERGSNPELRVVIHQPALPYYRIPVFRELATRSGVVLSVLHGSEVGVPQAAPNGFEAKESPIRTVGTRAAFYWAPDQWTLFTRTRPDVVVLNWNVRYLGLVPSLLRAKHRDVGVVLWGHGFSKKESRVRRWARLAVGRLADVVVLYDHNTAGELVHQHGFARDRVFVAPNTIDQDPIKAAQALVTADPGRLEAFKTEHKLTDRTVLFLSRLDPRNRVDVLLEAVAHLRTHDRAVRCVVMGSGPDLPVLTNRVTQLGLTDTVSFVPGTYDETELAPWFLSTNVFCYPSNAGLSLMHAFSYGLPVVVGNDRSSHNPEISSVRDGENGLLFSHNDSWALADVLRRFFIDDALQGRLRAGAIATAEQHPIKEMVDGLEAAIRAAGQLHKRN